MEEQARKTAEREEERELNVYERGGTDRGEDDREDEGDEGEKRSGAI